MCNPSRIHGHEELTVWTYDAINQLKTETLAPDMSWNTFSVNDWNNFTADDWGNFEASNASGETTTFTYDPVGNRTLKETETEVTTSTYDAANQLQTAEESSGITTYTYDASGNQTSVEKPSGDITTQTWDYENRMIALEHPDNSVVTYAYTAVNQQDEYLVEKETDTATTKYLWDNQNILQEYDVSTEAQYNYAPMPYGNLISQQRDTDSSYYHYDGNFSTSALTDTSATETDTYNYTAWGEETSGTGATENPFTWKGEIGYYQDEDDLQLLRNRRYSAAQGRFISEDPIGLESGESNFYAYVGNSPLNGIDPEGLRGSIPCNPAWTCSQIERMIANKKEQIDKKENHLQQASGKVPNWALDKLKGDLQDLYGILQDLQGCLLQNCPPLPSPNPSPTKPRPTNPGFPTLPSPFAPTGVNPNAPSGATCPPSNEEVEIYYNSGGYGFPPGPGDQCPIPPEPKPAPLKCPDSGIPGVSSSAYGGTNNLCMFIVSPTGPRDEQVRIIFPADDPNELDLAIQYAKRANVSAGLDDLKEGIEQGAVIVKGGIELVSGADDAEVILKAGFDPSAENLVAAGITIFLGYAAYKLLKTSKNIDFDIGDLMKGSPYTPTQSHRKFDKGKIIY
ncbi:RHS repeat-associated core domain-containing protein [uncultured Rubinisphaera sp.]|uniref:RHS repeat domain-containing protein n=1 Tax=uncultured Rubinisphaera sp. TaxID=1678686 RepID=UPI0030D9BDF5